MTQTKSIFFIVFIIGAILLATIILSNYEKMTYCKEIIMFNQNNEDLIGYDVQLFIDTKTPISEGKMKPDCSDIRFTDTYSLYPSEWNKNYEYVVIEGSCNTNNTEIYIHNVTIMANSTKIIYMCYGLKSVIIG